MALGVTSTPPPLHLKIYENITSPSALTKVFPIWGIKLHYLQFCALSFTSGPSAKVPTWKCLRPSGTWIMFLEIIVASLNSCPCVKVPNMPNFLVPAKMLKCVFRCFQNVVAGLNLCSSLEVPNFPTHQTVGVWNVVVHICLQRPALCLGLLAFPRCQAFLVEKIDCLHALQTTWEIARGLIPRRVLCFDIWEATCRSVLARFYHIEDSFTSFLPLACESNSKHRFLTVPWNTVHCKETWHKVVHDYMTSSIPTHPCNTRIAYPLPKSAQKSIIYIYIIKVKVFYWPCTARTWF